VGRGNEGVGAAWGDIQGRSTEAIGFRYGCGGGGGEGTEARDVTLPSKGV